MRQLPTARCDGCGAQRDDVRRSSDRVPGLICPDCIDWLRSMTADAAWEAEQRDALYEEAKAASR